MFVDILSWLSTQALFIGLVLLGFCIYDMNLWKTKFEKVRKEMRYKNFVIKEISPENNINRILVIHQEFSNRLVINKSSMDNDIRSNLFGYETFTTFKHNIPDIIFDTNTSYDFRVTTSLKISKDDDCYDEVVSYLKDKCKMNLDECIIYQGALFKVPLFVLGEKDNDKIIVRKASLTVDGLVQDLIPRKTDTLACISLWTISICTAIKFMLYCFA